METNKKLNQNFKTLKRKIKGLVKEDTISESALNDIKVACLSDLEIAKETESYLFNLLNKFNDKKKSEKQQKVAKILEFMQNDPTPFQTQGTQVEKTSTEVKNSSNSDQLPIDQKTLAKADETPKANSDDTPASEKSKEANVEKKADITQKKETSQNQALEKEKTGKKEVKQEEDPEKLKIKKEKELQKQQEKELQKKIKQQEKELEKIKKQEEKAKAKEAEKLQKKEEAAKKATEKIAAEKKVEKKIQAQPSDTTDSKEGLKKIDEVNIKTEEVKKSESPKRVESPKRDKKEQKSNILNEIFKEVPFNNCHHSRFALGDRPKFPVDVDIVFIDKPVSEMKSNEFEQLEREICSFLNTRGGRIFFGINSSQIVVGDTSPLASFEKLALKVALIVEDGIYPTLQPKHIKIDVLPVQNSESHRLLRIDVQKGEKLKLYCTSKGKYFYRNQGVLVKYTPEEVQDITTNNAIKSQEGIKDTQKEVRESGSGSEEEAVGGNDEKASWQHFRKDSKHWEKHFKPFLFGHGHRHGHHGPNKMYSPIHGGFSGHFDPRMMPPPFSQHAHPGFLNAQFQSPSQQQLQQSNNPEFDSFGYRNFSPSQRYPFFQGPFPGSNVPEQK